MNVKAMISKMTNMGDGPPWKLGTRALIGRFHQLQTIRTTIGWSGDAHFPRRTVMALVRLFCMTEAGFSLAFFDRNASTSAAVVPGTPPRAGAA